MDYVIALGLIAGSFTVISFLPQLIKIIKTKSTKDISLGMFVIFCTGALLWLAYGILINALPVITTNILIFTMALAILILKIKYK